MNGNGKRGCISAPMARMGGRYGMPPPYTATRGEVLAECEESERESRAPLLMSHWWSVSVSPSSRPLKNSRGCCSIGRPTFPPTCPFTSEMDK